MDLEGNCKKYALVILLLIGMSDLAFGGIREATASGSEDFPAPRFAHSMVYDAESDRIIMFGGLVEPAPTWSDETWTYDFNTNTWTNMKPAVRPSPRHGPGMAYDSESDRMILFGGTMRGELFGDTWAYDLNTNTWANLTPPTTTTTTTATTTTTTTTLPTETTTTFPPSQAVSTTTIGIGAVVAIATVLAIYLLMRKK